MLTLSSIRMGNIRLPFANIQLGLLVNTLMTSVDHCFSYFFSYAIFLDGHCHRHPEPITSAQLYNPCPSSNMQKEQFALD